jgi:glycosyltransferase involved in cell wall biosynthesis
MKTLRVLGIRGLPAAHGGFETFAEYLSLYLIERGWRVVVYCQEEGRGPVYRDVWRGVERIHIPVPGSGAWSSVVFDWKATLDAAGHRDLCITLGYNTAVFCSVLRLKGIPNVINMDGIEWSRAKWGNIAKTWFWMNDWAGCLLGNHLIADHPEIKVHLSSRAKSTKITTIAYGAEPIGDVPVGPVLERGLVPGRYLTLIARPEPENSILEVVKGFSAKLRGVHLAVLGNYSESNAYHKAVMAAAGVEVKFLGAIYEKPALHSLRKHSLAYVHGHQVGGTNPSLVEAMGAGNAIIAHDNRFTRWVAGDGARYFEGALGFSEVLDELLGKEVSLAAMRRASFARFTDEFIWPKILGEYEDMLTRFLPVRIRTTEVARRPSQWGNLGGSDSSNNR